MSDILNKQPPSHQSSTLRYLTVGVIANGLGLAIFQLLILAGVSPELSSFLSFFPAFTIAYILNRWWSFGSTIRHTTGVVRYAIATGACVLLQVVIVSFLFRMVGIVPWVAQIIALALATPLSYILLRVWVFRPGNTNEILR